jgi:hypothetical protein
VVLGLLRTLREVLLPKPPTYPGAVLGGPDLLAYLVLALGAAMAVGSLLALVRPPERRQEGDLERAPVLRSVAFAAIGLVAAVWALGSLLT